MVTLVPLEDKVVVETLSEQTTTESGIFIPDTATKERPQKGVVVAVGPGKSTPSGERIAMNVAVGDIVYFKKYSPDEFEIDGKKVLVMHEDSIIAKEGK